MSVELTERDEVVVGLIAESVRLRGYPPTVREIGNALGLTSPSTVHAMLTRMVDRGVLAIDPDRPRGIRIAIPVKHCPSCSCHGDI